MGFQPGWRKSFIVFSNSNNCRCGVNSALKMTDGAALCLIDYRQRVLVWQIRDIVERSSLVPCVSLCAVHFFVLLGLFEFLGMLFAQALPLADLLIKAKITTGA